MSSHTNSDEFELTLTDIANGGQAVGRTGGKTIFVPYTIPGETIIARILQDKGRYAFAEGVTLIEASGDRVIPRCPHFGPGKCGNCQWQHMDYPAQVALKTDLVIDQLERIGGYSDPPVEMTIPSPLAWGYSHQTVFYRTPDGKLGYKSTDGTTIIPIEECHIITPELLDLFEQFDLDLDTLNRVKMMENGVQPNAERLVIISTSDDQPPSLEIDFRASVNFLLSDNEPANLIGATHIIYTILGRPYRVTGGSFFRNNPAQIEVMLQVILQMLDLQGTESVLDLYSGVGVIAGTLAPHTSLITCVDSYPPAMTDAEENLAAFDHIDLIEGDVAEVLVNLEDPYEIAIVDPPLEGLTVEVIDALEAVQPATLIYISQDPAALSRDAKRLQARYNYRLMLAQPIDFDPQTYRIVTVAHFRKEMD